MNTFMCWGESGKQQLRHEDFSLRSQHFVYGPFLSPSKSVHNLEVLAQLGPLAMKVLFGIVK